MTTTGGERQWVRRLEPQLHASMQSVARDMTGVGVSVGDKLTYAHEILEYNWDSGDASRTRRSKYETDLLIYEHPPDKKCWVPRVVIECKLGGVTTHDALTYSSKAATHKHVHPYLRYGILIGNLGTCVPPRLMRHGAYFDFMVVWQAGEPHSDEWNELVEILRQEVIASRSLQDLLTGSDRSLKQYRLIHRPLRLEPMEGSAPNCDGMVDDEVG